MHTRGLNLQHWVNWTLISLCILQQTSGASHWKPGCILAGWHQPASSESRLEHSSDWQRHTIPEWPHHPEVPEGDHAGPNSGKQNAARRHGQPQWRLVQKSRSSAGLEGASPYIFRDYRNKTHAKERTLLLINTAMEIYYKKKTFEFIMIIP